MYEFWGVFWVQAAAPWCALIIAVYAVHNARFSIIAEAPRRRLIRIGLPSVRCCTYYGLRTDRAERNQYASLAFSAAAALVGGVVLACLARIRHA